MSPPRVTASGLTTNALTGERHIPSSVRADGSTRREIRIRPGYKPPEDVELYKNRAAAAWRNRGKAGVPGAEGLGKGSVPGAEGLAGNASANKNAKRREARRKAKAEGEGEGEGKEGVKGAAVGKDSENWRSGAAPVKEEVKEEPVDPEAEKEKKARALKKKLRQARDLREKKDKGENLLPEQFEKVIRINELIRQLDALGFDAEGKKKKPKEGENPEEKDTAV